MLYTHLWRALLLGEGLPPGFTPATASGVAAQQRRLLMHKLEKVSERVVVGCVRGRGSNRWYPGATAARLVEWGACLGDGGCVNRFRAMLVRACAVQALYAGMMREALEAVRTLDISYRAAAAATPEGGCSWPAR
jgi:hypothetical protein